MAFEPFNSVGGFTVGIPPTPVINDEGIATLTGLQVAGISNLGSINNVILLGGENGYFLQTDGSGGLTWAPGGNGGNGGNGTPGGSNSQVQFNNDGNFGGDAGFTYDNVNNILTVTGNIVAYNYSSTGNVTSNNIIGTNLTVANVNATRITSTGNISAGNANLGNLASANFYVGNGSLLTGITSTSANFANYAGNVTVSNQPNITSLGNLTSLRVNGNANIGNVGVNGGVFAITLSAIGNANVGNINGSNGIFNLLSGTITTNAQPNITSVGTLSSLSVTGNVNLGNVGNIHIAGGTTGYVLTTNGNGNLSWQASPPTITAVYVTANHQPNITSTGTLTILNVNGQSTLGPAGNVHIAGGTSGYLLTTNGNGNLSWTAPANGGDIGGANRQVQFNDNGSFAGSSVLTFDKTSNTLQINGNLISNTIQMGSTGYTFSTQSVYFAITTSTSVDQVLWSVPAANVSGVDFHIISTDSTGSTRQSTKISSLLYGTTVVWNEYGSLQVNGGTGSFSVEYQAGGTPRLALLVTPDSANSTTYKMMITEYAP